ncbi:MAG: T9SS type A sorting domain-containing protein [Armatimonadetes bacterium]|nr:T9SS type A sorting domain-containing protein [Armatimonadota bacterium]
MKKAIFSLLAIFFAFSLFTQEPEWTLYATANKVNCQVIQDSINWIGTDIALIRYNIETNDYIAFNSYNSVLPGNYIWSLAKQNNGTIWIGTKYGLAKYDGSQWTIFTITNSNLPNNWIPSIAIAPNGTVWIGTAGGLVSIIDSVWTVYNTNNSNLTNDYIRNLAVDENNVVWIATWGGGLVTFDGEDWSVISSIPADNITEVEIDNEGRKWVGTNIGCFCLSDTSLADSIVVNNLVVYNMSNSSLPSDDVFAFAFDDNNGTWIGTLEGLAYLYNGNWTVYSTNNSSILFDDIYSLRLDNFGTLWCGGLGGLVNFNGEDWNEISVGTADIPTNWIEGIDTYGSEDVWVSTKKGICHFNGSDWSTYTSNNSNLLSDSATDIAIDSEGNVWVICRNISGGSSYAYGFAYFNGDEWIHYIAQNSQLPWNWTSDIIVDNLDRAWITCQHWLIKIENDDWVMYNLQDYGFNFTVLPTALSYDYANNIYIAIYNYDDNDFLLVKFDGENFEIVCDLIQDVILDIICDESGVIWLGTFNSGLVRFDGEVILFFDQTNSPLPSNYVLDIEIENHILWICNDGLVKMDDYEWAIFNHENSPLPSNYIRCVAIDDDGTKWIGTYRGLFAYNENLVVVHDEFQVEENAPRLIHNYPNPFNPTTTISYQLTADSDVDLKIYNVKGQLGETLVNEFKPSGKHSIVWNAEKQASGIYFYKLKAGDFEEIRKMILLK